MTVTLISALRFQKPLRFHEHINIICHKVNKTLSPLYPIAKDIPRPILDQIYKTYVRPHFDCADIIYDGHITVQDANRLETLQNRAARLITGGLFRTSTNKLMTELGWERLHTRRNIHRLTFYHQLNAAEHQPPYLTAVMPQTRAQDTNKHLRNASNHTTTAHRTTAYKKIIYPHHNQTVERTSTSHTASHAQNLQKTTSQAAGGARPASIFQYRLKMGKHFTGCPEKFDTQVFCNKIRNKHGMSKIQASLYSKLNGKASDVSYKHLH